MMLTEPDDGSGRLFIVDQIGLVRILAPGGELLDTPFLDLRDRLVPLNPRYDERGLLSLAFHPGYAENGRLFVFYSAPLRPEAPGLELHEPPQRVQGRADDPDRADPGSERVSSPSTSRPTTTTAAGPLRARRRLPLPRPRRRRRGRRSGHGHTPGRQRAGPDGSSGRSSGSTSTIPARTERRTRSRPTTRSRTPRASSPRSTPRASGIRHTSPSTPGPGTGRSPRRPARRSSSRSTS